MSIEVILMCCIYLMFISVNTFVLMVSYESSAYEQGTVFGAEMFILCMILPSDYFSCGWRYSGTCSDIQWSASQNFCSSRCWSATGPVITNFIHSFQPFASTRLRTLGELLLSYFKLKRISILTLCIAKYSIWKCSFHNSLSCILMVSLCWKLCSLIAQLLMHPSKIIHLQILCFHSWKQYKCSYNQFLLQGCTKNNPSIFLDPHRQKQ